MRPSPVVLALLATLPPLLAAQVVPTRTLAKADAEWSEPFSQISGMRELKDGRVIVTDIRDKNIQLIDFAGEAKKIGREGAGPGEFGLPSQVYAAPGDMTWVYDVLNGRYLVIDPSGKPVSTFTTDDAASTASVPAPGPGGVLRSSLRGFAQGIDAQGRLYFRAPSFRFENGAGIVSDTIPIVRWNPTTKASDTVGSLINPPSPPPAPPVATGGGNSFSVVRMGSTTPFGSSDSYAVTAKGDVAVVRARDYHVDWIVNGRTIAGAPIKYDPVKITKEDKLAFVENRKNSSGTMVINDGSGRRVENLLASALDGPNAPVFPEFKGPFRSVVAGPNSQVWVERNVAFDQPAAYDVIDITGKVVSRVFLPKRTRLLGFGIGTVYLIRTDEDDLQYLQRYRW